MEMNPDNALERLNKCKSQYLEIKEKFMISELEDQF